MACINRFLCWSLRTATFVCYLFIVVTGFFALLLRLVDLVATGTSFEISQGFHTNWRSHSAESFLACNIIMTIMHVVEIIFSMFMLYLISQRHFLMTLTWTKVYMCLFICYMVIELGVSLFEFSYYGMDTFRRAYVVFIWLYWLLRSSANVFVVVIIMSRYQQMIEEVEMELRFAGEKRKGYF